MIPCPGQDPNTAAIVIDAAAACDCSCRLLPAGPLALGHRKAGGGGRLRSQVQVRLPLPEVTPAAAAVARELAPLSSGSKPGSNSTQS